MIEKVLNPVLELGGKAVAKVSEIIVKEGAKQGAKIAAHVASYLMVIVIAACLTSNYKDKASAKLNKKHDKETAEKLTKQFQQEIENLKKEIAELKKGKDLAKKEAEERFRNGVIEICKKYGISPDGIVK